MADLTIREMSEPYSKTEYLSRTSMVIFLPEVADKSAPTISEIDFQ